MIRRRLLIDLNLAICVILGLFIVLMFAFTMNGGNVDTKDESFSDGWIYADGTPVDFSDLRTDAGPQTIMKTVSPGQVKGGDLCFETSNLFFNVYVNDRLVYEFYPELLSISGKYYGEYIHTVDLSVFEDDSVIKIDYDPLTDTDWTSFRDMRLQEGSSYIRGVLADHFIHFLSSFVVLIIGITVIIFGLLVNQDTDRIVETVSLGTTAIILALWTITGSRYLQIISGNSAIVRILDHFTLMWLPVPVILFVASVTGLLKSRLTKINLALVGINTIAMISLVFTGRLDYHDMLKFTHIIIGFGVLTLIHMMFISIKKSRQEQRKIGRGLKVLLVAFGLLVTAGMIDGIRYYTTVNKDSSLATRIGLFVFVIVLTCYELSKFLELNKKSVQAEIMDKLAHNDGLTGMLNRLAFTETESRIREAQTGKFVVAQFDINYLKKINDNYGHAEGDRFITTAADILQKSFGQKGKCYRIGGDEFFVVMEGDTCEKDFDEAVPVFEELLKKCNDNNEFPIPLNIAYGKSVYVPGSNSLDEAEKSADELMYDNKKKIKEKS